MTCPTTCIKEELLDATLRETFRHTTISDDNASRIQSAIDRSFGNRAAIEAATRTQIEGALGNAEARLSRLTDAYVDGQIEKSLFEERRSSLLLEKQDLQQRLRTVSADLGENKRLLATCLELAKRPEFLYENATTTEKRRLIEILTSNRLVAGKSVEISSAEPFQFLAGARETACCAPKRGKPRTKKWSKHKIQRVADQLFNWAKEEAYKDAPNMERLRTAA
jgi:hypothetical protein